MQKTTTQTKYNPEKHILIRGIPRNKENVRYVEEYYGGTLVPDKEANLLLQLDTHLKRYTEKEGKYPDFIALPNDKLNLYLPVPYEISFGGFKAKVFIKPAWFRVKRHFVVGTK